MGGWWILCWYTTVLFEKLLIGKIHSQCSQRSCDNNRQNCYGQHQCSAGKPQGQGHGTDGSLNRGLRQISDDAEQALLQIQSGSEQAEHGAQRTEHKGCSNHGQCRKSGFKRIADIYSGSNQNKKNNLCRDPQFSKFFRKTG